MLALGVWPLKIDSSKVYHSDLEQGLSPNSISRRGFVERLDLAPTSVLFVSRISESRFNFLRFYGPQKHCIGSFSALPLLSEEQATICTTSEQDQLSRSRVTTSTQAEAGIIKGKRTRVRVDVKELAQRLHTAKNADDVEDILKNNDELPLQVYSTLIKGLSRNNRLDSAVSLVEWLRRRRKKDTSSTVLPNLFIYNSLLGAAKEAEKYDVVDKVIEDMSSAAINPNIVTYNILMSSYIQKGQELEALNLFYEIPNKGLSPSPVSYSTALFAHRRLQDAFGAVKLFTELRDKYHAKDEFPKLENFTTRICYQVMRQWMSKREKSSTDILRLMIEMDKVGLQLGCVESERLIWACTREEHYSIVKELYQRIRERDSGNISLTVCNHVIWLMGKAKKWWAALEVYEDLLLKGPKPNQSSDELIVSHFDVLLSAARKRGIWKWSIRLLNKMEEKGIKPRSKEWNNVLVSCSKASETSAAIEIFKRMVGNGETPTIVSYGALLSALEKGRLYDEADRVWKHMATVGVKANLYTYTTMAAIYSAQSKSNAVNSIIREMVTLGIDPTVVTFNAVISACIRNGMGSAGYEWFQEMKAANISPNEVTYEMLVVGLASDGKPRMAFELYVRALREGMVLSAKAYDAVIRSSLLHGLTIDVTTLGLRPVEKHRNVQSRNSLMEKIK
ncbi:unnamed protein product [Cuscuta epithymum]|uniref:Pentacotripeptide-repeat region of PRORP domain-containing protein n=1 Tax=Cuscuta epithymum TaxID=186058 RepID=A0AAV0D2G9_9ASTE|nr:unnamed protein product [Cuscuta epithymum]